jgi:hypothetical protein
MKMKMHTRVPLMADGATAEVGYGKFKAEVKLEL